ncbi:MAG: type II toxin-antitoxin system HicA family toxin [Candidatus Micrarchaeota archaeon]
MENDEGAARKPKQELAAEVAQLAGLLGYEGAASGRNALHLLYRFYQEEKAREESGAERLKKAEEMILRLSSLHYEEQRKEMERKRAGGTARFKWRGSGGIPAGKKAKELLASIGITDEHAASFIAETIGEAKIEERVELVGASMLGGELVKKVFALKPELMLAPTDGAFLESIDAIERKKGIIDIWSDGREIAPADAIYNHLPDILFEDYHEISRLLELKPPESHPSTEKEDDLKLKLSGRKISPDDFVKVLKRLGFQAAREDQPHRVYKHPDGRVAVVQKYGAGEEFGPGLIKMKLRDFSIDPSEFERARQELKV